ncbi:hypothetical protein CSB45_02330 [candidate division KSB3 bacterium]|uniref:Polysaccharide export protein N-terminal domain-containing protein n=1 Tax=candidate division KSB3 bacterium TaxID=2044937 RepID=A0A2G6E9V3_9BACT|nr:MAG: hypothetical protein CSB45_02330 [candidate division KSB3 bacterium]PIE30917.1 MAG: hypothetical protein CSA57_00940 [candidate division KSB3 bacterium]
MLTRRLLKGQVAVGFIWLCCAFPVFSQIGNVREFVIGVGDQLNISIWGIPELSSRVRVRLDGKITMPRLGDIPTAGLKISSLKAYLAGEEDGKETIGKYVKDPNITISVVQPADNILVNVSGIVSRSLSIPRQTRIGQVLKTLVPQLPVEPPPNLRNIMVVSAEGENFPVDWVILRTGKAPEMDVSLEWGDDIRIPAGALPTPTPVPTVIRENAPGVSYSEEELLELFQHAPDVLKVVQSLATQFEDGVYTFDLAAMSDDEKALLGKDMLNLLFNGPVDANSAPFTDARLAGISVDLRLADVLEAYLAFPASLPDALPVIKRFHEGDLVEKGREREEDVYLKEIVDDKKLVIVEQGDRQQFLPLAAPFSEARLSGVFDLGDTRKAVFSDLPEWSGRKPRKRMYLEGDLLEKDVKVAQITTQWVLLQKGNDTQLLLLRDSYNRHQRAVQAQGDAFAGSDVTLPQEVTGQGLQELPEGALQQMLPKELKALDSLSKLFFATPIFE